MKERMCIAKILNGIKLGIACRTLVLGAFVAALGLVRPHAAQATANPANDADSIQFTLRPNDIWPPVPITDLTGTAGAEGQALLQWTSPIEDAGIAIPKPTTISSYTVYLATFSVLQAPFSGNTTTWLNTAGTMVAPPAPLAPSFPQSLLTSLNPGVTYYFGIKSTDLSGLTSGIDDNTTAGVSQAVVGVRGIDLISDLTALQGGAFGEIDLVWTEPSRIGQTEPSRYVIRASSKQQISTQAEFDDPTIAMPLTAFGDTSLSALPAPGFAPGQSVAVTLTGMARGCTLYFAVRAEDGGLPAFIGNWLRSESLGINTSNFAQVPFTPGVPNAITQLSGLPGAQTGSIALNWTAPLNPNGVKMDRYVVKINTNSIASLPMGTTWFDLANSTTVVVPAAANPGDSVLIQVTGLENTQTYFIAVKSIDKLGEVSPIDDPAATILNQVRVSPAGIPTILNVTAVTSGISGAIDLSWTEPDTAALIPPIEYIVYVSTLQNINNDSEFDDPTIARPLSSLSSSPIPTPQPGENPVTFPITGLVPNVTYYFAVRTRDSVLSSGWFRGGIFNANSANFASAGFVPGAANGVTNLTAVTGGAVGEIDLTWSKPVNENFTPVVSYDVRFATFSAASLLGDATAWFNAVSSQSILNVSEWLPGGTTEFLTLSNLDPGTQVFVGMRAIDREGAIGAIDFLSATAGQQVNATVNGMGRITDLAPVAGVVGGSIDLIWSAPNRAATVEPSSYVVRISSIGNITTDAEFSTALTVAFISGSSPTLPNAGVPGFQETVTLTGLVPFINYCFAVVAVDSSATPLSSLWSQGGINASNCTQSAFVPNLPNQITDLTALTGSIEGEIDLSWTAPRNENFVPMSGYEVRYATFAVLADQTTAWFNAASASSILINSVQVPGSLETYTLNGLFPSSTFYVAVRSFDIANEISAVDVRADTPGDHVFRKPFNVAPAQVTGLAASAGLLRIDTAWSDLPAGLGGKGLDFVHYRLERSTDSGFSPIVPITTQTALSFGEFPLDAGTTFYYRVIAVDSEGLESIPSVVSSTQPYTLPPMAPFGVEFARAGSTVTITFATTTRFSDSTAFIDTTTPRADEFSGYEFYRSTGECGGFVLIGTAPHNQPYFSDTNNSEFYLIRSTNSQVKSQDSVVVSPFGDRLFFLPDCKSRVEVSNEEAQRLLLKKFTGLSADIQIARIEHVEENGGKKLTTVEFKPMLDGKTPVENFHFNKPVKIVLSYKTDGTGAPTPSGLGVAAAAPAATNLSAEDLISNMGMFWHNNVEYKKLYGTVNRQNQTVSAFTPNIGLFQLRTIYREQAATFDLSNITTRVITPNGDNRNDQFMILFDNPNRAHVHGKIFDMRGAYVADMAPGPQPHSLIWDGKMNGRTVTSGVYVYQVEGDGKMFNGTVVVAR
jgi:gliding motility-associated-like protein